MRESIGAYYPGVLELKKHLASKTLRRFKNREYHILLWLHFFKLTQISDATSIQNSCTKLWAKHGEFHSAGYWSRGWRNLKEHGWVHVEAEERHDDNPAVKVVKIRPVTLDDLLDYRPNSFNPGKEILRQEEANE